MNPLLLATGQLMPFPFGKPRNAHLLHRQPGNAVVFCTKPRPAAGVNQTPEQHHVFNRYSKRTRPGLFEESHTFGAFTP
ncbi:hypothetical protein D3C80_1689820 [compost metagenome]